MGQHTEPDFVSEAPPGLCIAPPGVLTGGAAPPELDQALRVARTIVNALARAELPAIAVRTAEPAAEGARPRGVAAQRQRRTDPQPPL